MYLWTLLTHKPGDSPYVAGVTDDLAKARLATEPGLKSRKAFVCYIEQVRYAMNATDMSASYASVGRYWVGQLGARGRVRWTEHGGTAPGQHCPGQHCPGR